MAGKSLTYFDALPGASQQASEPAYAEVYLYKRDMMAPFVVHRILSEKAFDNLEEAHQAAVTFIEEKLVEAEEDGNLILAQW